MKLFFENIKSPHIRVFSLLLCFLVIQIIISFFFLRQISFQHIKDKLNSLVHSIDQDIKFRNSKWDISLYNSDPTTPHPSGSSGFSTPLYIITSEGFVIERNRPISGVLDSSDYKHLMLFQKPQTFTTVTNERWRVLSKPIIRNGKTYGVIMVSYYNPQDDSLTRIDQTLQENLTFIDNKVELQNNSLNIQKVDIRNVHYDVAFEIVTTFNKVLLNNGRIPTFIDVSYIDKEIHNKQTRIVKDNVSNEEFYIHSKVLKDPQNNPFGIIILAESINSINNMLKDYILFSVIFSGIIIIPFTFFVSNYVLKEKNEAIENYKKTLSASVLPKQLCFNAKGKCIQVENERVDIPFPSNQYFLCENLFSKPHKVWTQEELMNKLAEKGEEHSRKLYDASLALNKKFPFKLIDYKDKTYKINSDLLPYITK